MNETAGVALATLFATVGPLDLAAIFAGLTASHTPKERHSLAIRGTLMASTILLIFALIGEFILANMGISLAALRTAGGILLLLISIDMVFARHSGATSTTEDENMEASTKQDIAVFPVATPLIAGPGSMGAIILLMANTKGDLVQQGIVIGSLIAIMIITLICMFAAAQLIRLLGVTGIHVITRVFGVLLAALSVQFMFDGIIESGILG
jgi:multiple antibiotic resistance protein